jgi:hypothetical protein
LSAKHILLTDKLKYQRTHQWIDDELINE